MKQLIFIIPLFFSLFFSPFCSKAVNQDCSKAFDETVNLQFITVLKPFLFKTKKHTSQIAFKNYIKSLTTKSIERRVVLNYLIYIEQTAQSVLQAHPLFDYILNKSNEETIKFMQKLPHTHLFLREGALFNMPPFFLMILMGNKTLVNFALKTDPTLALMENKLKEGPLHYAVDAEMATILLNNKANPDKQDKKGQTALHNIRDPELAQVLIDHFSGLSLKNHSGMTPLKHHINLVGDKQIISLLEQAVEKQKAKKFESAPPQSLPEPEEIKPTNKELAQKRKEEIRAKRKAKTAERKAKTATPKKTQSTATNIQQKKEEEERKKEEEAKKEEERKKEEKETQYRKKTTALEKARNAQILKFENQVSKLKLLTEKLKDLYKLQIRLEWQIKVAQGPLLNFFLTKRMKNIAQHFLRKTKMSLEEVNRDINNNTKLRNKLSSANKATSDEIDRITKELESHLESQQEQTS